MDKVNQSRLRFPDEGWRVMIALFGFAVWVVLCIRDYWLWTHSQDDRRAAAIR